MAEVKQDFIKFSKDYFNIRYTVTDSTNISNYRGLWFMTTNFASPTISNTVMKRHDTWMTSANWTCTVTPSIGNINFAVTDTTGFTIGTSYVDITVSYALMAANFPPTTSYYHELVLSPDGDPCNSLVVATGWMEVRKALFTEEGYR